MLDVSKQLNVMLEEDTKQIEEVVVTGEKKKTEMWRNLQMSMGEGSGKNDQKTACIYGWSGYH